MLLLDGSQIWLCCDLPHCHIKSDLSWDVFLHLYTVLAITETQTAPLEQRAMVFIVYPELRLCGNQCMELC